METVGGIPVPEPSELTQPFWDACLRNELRVQQCSGCGAKIFTPLPACPQCLSREWEWVLSPGTGTLYSFTVVHRPSRPDRPTPYVIATVDLDDGWTMMTNIVDCDPAALRCGDRVKVRFTRLTEGINLPTFIRCDD